MTFLKNMLGGGGSAGGASIAEDMFFATTNARDVFTTTHPNRLFQGVTCAVTNAGSYDYYQWDVSAATWRDANLIFQGRKGDPGTPGTDGDPTTLIDDAAASASKTFSSNKVNALFQTEGSKDNGKVTGLAEKFYTSSQIKQGKTYVVNWNAAISELPDLDDKKAILNYIGLADSSEQLFLLASATEGLYYWYRINGFNIGWNRIPLINDSSTNTIDTLSASKIIALANAAYTGPSFPTTQINKVVAGASGNAVQYIRSSALFNTNSETSTIANITDSTYDLLDVMSSRFTVNKTKDAGSALVLNTDEIAQEIDGLGSDIELADKGNDTEGNMILGVSLVKYNGTKVERTISIRGGSQPLPPMEQTTVVYGWTNNEEPNIDDIRFALQTEQTSTWKTRTEGVNANALATTTFVAKRAGSELKNFYIAHLTDFFDPEPYAINWGLGVDDDIIITNISYDGKVGRAYTIGTTVSGAVANSESQISVQLIQGS